MNNLAEIKVKTNKGTLSARTVQCDEYPGITLYFDNEIIAALEVYEEDGLLRLRGYNQDDDEPIVLATLIDFNKEKVTERAE